MRTASSRSPGPAGLRRSAAATVNASNAFFSRSRVQGGQLERAGAGAVAVVADREVRQRPGLGLLLLQLPAFGGVGGLGTDHLEQPLPQLPSVGASNSFAWSSMCASARSRVPGGRSSYSSVNASTAAVTIRGLLHIDQPGGQRGRVAWNVVVELLAPDAGPGAAGRVVVLVACASHAGVDVAPVSAPTCRRGRPATSTRSSSSASRACCLRSSTNASSSSSGRHRPHRHLGQPVQRPRQRRGEPHHRMRLRRTVPPGGGGGTNVNDMTPR